MVKINTKLDVKKEYFFLNDQSFYIKVVSVRYLIVEYNDKKQRVNARKRC
jgi:hypothetical protein